SVLRPSIEEMAIGGFIWGLSLVAPPCFAIVGLIRLTQVGAAIVRKPAIGPIAKAANALPDDYVVAPTLELPDGRRIRNVVIGPFGLAAIGEAPPGSVTRRHGGSWEVRRADGRWVPLEHPVERTARDAERLRRWIGAE